MKVSVTEIFDFPPEVIFAVIVDIPHHADWLEEPIELVSLVDGPAQIGTKWRQNANRLGRKLTTLNTCNLFEKNRKFGWITEKPFLAQVTLLLKPARDKTKLTWMVESERAGIVQLAEPMLIKQTNALIQIFLNGLRAFLQDRARSQTYQKFPE